MSHSKKAVLMSPEKSQSQIPKFKQMTLLEAKKNLSEIISLTDQPLVGLETLHPLQAEMESYRAELEACPHLYESEDTWLKVCNTYSLAYFRVMLRVSELLERSCA